MRDRHFRRRNEWRRLFQIRWRRWWLVLHLLDLFDNLGLENVFRDLDDLAAKTGGKVGEIQKLTVWGNHSPTMYADYRFATIGGKAVKDLINDQVWNETVFLPTVGKRGAAIIATSLALVGMLMGITAILAGVGPRTPLDLVAHAVMVAVLVAGLLAAVRYRGPATYGGDPGRLEARRRAG